MRSHRERKILVFAASGLLWLSSVAHAAVSTIVESEKRAPVSGLDLATSPSAHSSMARDARVPLGKPNVRSNSVLVLDASNSTVLYSRQADIAAPIASITKLMTALVVLDAKLPMDETLEITTADRDNERGSASRLSVGAKLSRSDLLHLALMSSENRAAHALGRNYPGGLPAFVAAMNSKAKSLGMSNAHFVDPTGLSSDNVASPTDLSRLVVAASRNALIRRYSTDWKYEVPVGRRKLEFRNTNSLVNNPSWDITVQKTGYINEAGKCLVMQAVIEGRNVVIVLLDSFGKYTRVADAKRIRQWMETKQVRLARAR